MQFSILIPVYNVELYLEKCIKSVLDQKFDSYEIILVDDGSTDTSGTICDDFKIKFPNKIKVVHQKNKGLMATRRRLFELAKGDYCLCLDSDDFLNLDALQKIFEVIKKNDPDFVLYDLNYYNDVNGKTWKLSCPLTSYKKYYNLELLINTLLDLKFPNCSICAKCVRTELVTKEFDYSKFLHICFGEDTLQSIILYNNSKNFVYIDTPIYYYRVGSGMTKSLPLKYLSDFYEITKVMTNVWNDQIRNIHKHIISYYSKIYFEYLYNLLQNNKDYNNLLLAFEDADIFVRDNVEFNIDYKVCKNVIKRFILKHKFYRVYYILWKIKIALIKLKTYLW